MALARVHFIRATASIVKAAMPVVMSDHQIRNPSQVSLSQPTPRIQKNRIGVQTILTAKARSLVAMASTIAAQLSEMNGGSAMISVQSGAWALLEWTWQYRNKFLETLLPKALPAREERLEDSDKEVVRREQKSLQEVGASLKAFWMECRYDRLNESGLPEE
jgi:hypothetical protein